jgi:hypothetical protein
MDFLQEVTEITETIKRTLFPLLPSVNDEGSLPLDTRSLTLGEREI